MIAAAAQGAARINRLMSEFSSSTVRPQSQLAVNHDATADPGFAVDLSTFPSLARPSLHAVDARRRAWPRIADASAQ